MSITDNKKEKETSQLVLEKFAAHLDQSKNTYFENILRKIPFPYPITLSITGIFLTILYVFLFILIGETFVFSKEIYVLLAINTGLIYQALIGIFAYKYLKRYPCNFKFLKMFNSSIWHEFFGYYEQKINDLITKKNQIIPIIISGISSTFSLLILGIWHVSPLLHLWLYFTVFTIGMLLMRNLILLYSTVGIIKGLCQKIKESITRDRIEGYLIDDKAFGLGSLMKLVGNFSLFAGIGVLFQLIIVSYSPWTEKTIFKIPDNIVYWFNTVSLNLKFVSFLTILLISVFLFILINLIRTYFNLRSILSIIKGYMIEELNEEYGIITSALKKEYNKLKTVAEATNNDIESIEMLTTIRNNIVGIYNSNIDRNILTLDLQILTEMILSALPIFIPLLKF